MLARFRSGSVNWGAVLLAGDILSALLSPFISFAYRNLTIGPYPMGPNFFV